MSSEAGSRAVRRQMLFVVLVVASVPDAVASEKAVPRCIVYGRPAERRQKPPGIDDCASKAGQPAGMKPARQESHWAGKRGAWQLAQGKCYLLDMGVVLGVQAVIGVGATLVELGAGTGCYARAFAHTGRALRVLAAYDGAEGVEQLSGGAVRRADLSQPLAARADWVFSIETGEHIPSPFEATFLDNVANTARVGAVLSWAVPGQPGVGHVNGRAAGWVVDRMAQRHFALDANKTAALKRSASLWFLHRNLQVFRRVVP